MQHHNLLATADNQLPLLQHIHDAILWASMLLSATKNTSTADDKNCTKHGTRKGAPTANSSIAYLPYICTHEHDISCKQPTILAEPYTAS